MTLFDMSGKSAVITGSTRGIGRAIAERMAEHGAKVVISSRKQDVCDAVTKEINDKFGKGTAVAIAANISSKENLQHLVDESNRAFGKIDVLVCNAASNPYYGPLGGISDEQFRKILDNNIVANNWLTSMVVPQMIERKDGSVIIVSSIGGLKGSTVLGAYAISKAADMQLARNLACEYGKHNIRVNCIAPGLIKTDFAKALWDNPETLKASTARSPLLAHRHPRRNRGCGGVHGIGGRQLHDRADHRDRRWGDDQLRPGKRLVVPANAGLIRGVAAIKSVADDRSLSRGKGIGSRRSPERHHLFLTPPRRRPRRAGSSGDIRAGPGPAS